MFIKITHTHNLRQLCLDHMHQQTASQNFMSLTNMQKVTFQGHGQHFHSFGDTKDKLYASV